MQDMIIVNVYRAYIESIVIVNEVYFHGNIDM
jgi:hypothetical protein